MTRALHFHSHSLTISHQTRQSTAIKGIIFPKQHFQSRNAVD